LADAFFSQFSRIYKSSLYESIVRVLGNRSVLAIQALEIAAGHKDRIAFRRCGMQSGRSDCWTDHLANTGFTFHPIYPAPVFTEFTFLKVF
jgi:hypothetical protein